MVRARSSPAIVRLPAQPIGRTPRNPRTVSGSLGPEPRWRAARKGRCLSIGTAPEPNRSARRLARAAIAASLLFGSGPVSVMAESALRSPVGEMAGEYWDLVARLDSGHWLVAQTYVSNLGPGDGRAGAQVCLLYTSPSPRD